MGAHIYCENCGCPMSRPNLREAIIIDEYTCPGCHADMSQYVSNEDLISYLEELEDRINKLERSINNDIN